ncbi:MAG: hypothetical protein ACK5Q5_12990 [Planctomycetaceae bacterium]
MSRQHDKSTISAGLLFLMMVAVLPAESPTADESIPSALRRLGAEDFDIRTAAMRTLLDAGVAAVQPLAEAASHEPERATEFMALLDKLARSPDQLVVQAADEAIRDLAYSEHVTVAQAARSLRRPGVPYTEEDRQRLGLIEMLPVISRIVDNRRETRFIDDERPVEIIEFASGRIYVNVSQSTNDQTGNVVVTADNAEQLREKNAGAFELYQRREKRLPRNWHTDLWDFVQNKTRSPRSTSIMQSSSHRRIRCFEEMHQVDIVEGLGSPVQVRIITLINGNDVVQEIEGPDFESIRRQAPQVAEICDRLRKEADVRTPWSPMFP